MMPIGRQIRELDSYDSRGAPVLSMYITTDPDVRSPGQSEFDAERTIAALGAGLPAPLQADLLEELDVIRDYLGSMVAVPRGIALFSCARRNFFRVVRLPVPVRLSAYWQAGAQTRPLREAADRAWGESYDEELSLCP
jgi:hypothetical protein